MLGDVRAKLLGVDLLVVLRRDDDVVDRLRLAVIAVAHCDLDLAVGTQVVESLGPAHLGQPPREAVSKADRQWHELGGFIAREAEHHPGVACAADVHSLSDVGRLLIDARHHAASLGVEPVAGSRVAHLAHRLAKDLGDVDVTVGGDLPHHHREARGDDRLAGYPRQRVLGEDRVQDRVGDLVGELVGMAFGN